VQKFDNNGSLSKSITFFELADDVPVNLQEQYSFSIVLTAAAAAAAVLQ